MKCDSCGSIFSTKYVMQESVDELVLATWYKDKIIQTYIGGTKSFCKSSFDEWKL